jgi:protein translocase SecG subunit
MYIFLMILHVLISAALIIIILAQTGKGGALDGLVGGTANTMFGTHGASAFLDKGTKILGAIWIISSLFLAMNVRHMSAPARARALERLRAEEQEHVPPAEQDVFGEDGLPLQETPAPADAVDEASPAPDQTPPADSGDDASPVPDQTPPAE